MGEFVTLSMGQLEGSRTAEDTVVFWGVRYAQAPVEALRFAPPQPVQSWEGVRKADTQAPVSLQASSLISTAKSQSEDCLWMNIWTPGLEPKAKRPVMVYLHGGASNGDPNAAVLCGSHLAKRGDVVVCVLSWRLGVLGMLRAPEMDAVNLGLRDQCAALRFLRREAEAFGGDPENITIFGESSGGSFVGALLASPHAEGLFDKAIAQSPGPWYVHNVPASVEEAKSTLFAKALGLGGIEDLTLARLRSLDGEALVRAQTAAAAMPTFGLSHFLRLSLRQLGHRLWPRRILSPTLTLPFALHQSWRHPTTDGETILQTHPVGSTIRQSVPLLVGCTALEWGLFAMMGYKPPCVAAQVSQFAARLIPPGRDHQEARLRAATTLTEAYLAHYETLEQAYLSLASDLLFVFPAHQLAAAHAAHMPGDTYVYQLAYPYAGKGPWHTVDLPLVFGTYEAQPKALPLPDDAASMAATMMALWSNFARTGKPQSDGPQADGPQADAIDDWTPYEDADGKRLAMRLARPCRVVDCDEEVLPQRALHANTFAQLGNTEMFCAWPEEERKAPTS